jgi:hypothetical protein
LTISSLSRAFICFTNRPRIVSKFKTTAASRNYFGNVQSGAPCTVPDQSNVAHIWIIHRVSCRVQRVRKWMSQATHASIVRQKLQLFCFLPPLILFWAEIQLHRKWNANIYHRTPPVCFPYVMSPITQNKQSKQFFNQSNSTRQIGNF